MSAASSGAGSLLQMSIALIAVLAVIFALAWVARRMQRGGLRGAAVLRAHASLSLGPRERAVLVEAAGQYLLLGVASGQVRVLHRYDTAPELPVPDGAPSANDFLSHLRASLRGSK